MRSVLEVSGLNVFYGDLQALWSVSLEVNKGEVVALLGSNGAGKSTLLKTISCTLRPSSGYIKFLGERIDTLPPHKVVEKGISLVPEGRRLFSFMTVFENLMLGAYTREAEKKTMDLLKLVFEYFPILRERRNQLAGTLSGGEQQMLAIGRALMSNPRLILLDEPSVGLGPKPIENVFKVLEQLNKEGLTILLVEQNIHRALRLANRAYLLENGRITLSGKSEEILKDERVRKGYIGI